jgi:ABC-type nitrate/sulfonate/bicarbonate transport system substrate-binding protein
MKIFPATLAVPLLLGLFSSLNAQDKKLTTVNAGYAAISGSFAPLWVGFDQGLFTKYGLDPKMTYIRGNRVMMSALTAGEIQLYQGGAEGLIREHGRDVPKILPLTFHNCLLLAILSGKIFTIGIPISNN